MKRLFVWMSLLVMLPVGSAFAREKHWTVRELYGLYQGQRWQGEYATFRGETVIVDVPIIVPDVDAAPVIRVGDYPALDKTLSDDYGTYPKSYRDDVDAWARSDGRDITLAMDQYWEYEIPDQYAGKSHFGEEVYLPEGQRSPDCNTSVYECDGCAQCPCIRAGGSKKPLAERHTVLNVSECFLRQREAMEEKNFSPEDRLLRGNRFMPAEGTFASIKVDMHFRQFLLRGRKRSRPNGCSSPWLRTFSSFITKPKMTAWEQA